MADDRSADDASAGLVEVWRAIDATFARVRTRHPAALACRAGCADCCAAGLAVTAREAEAIARFVLGLDEAAAAALRALTERAADDASCALLDSDAACSIYPARPVVCRTFGLPHRAVPELAFEDGKRRLRVLERGATEGAATTHHTCGKNFLGVRDNELTEDVIVDQAFIRWRIRPEKGTEPLIEVVRAALAMRIEVRGGPAR